MHVIVTGNEDLDLNKSAKILASLKRKSVTTHFLSTIRTIKKPLSARSIAALKQLSCYDYLLFTSANAVMFFDQSLKEQRIELPQTKDFPKVIAVGPETAKACREVNLRVSMVPKEFSNKEVVKMLKKEGLQGKRILFPQSAIGSTEIVKDMRAAGAHVLVIPLYTTLPVQLQTPAEKASFAAMFEFPISYITFMSPSSVQSFRASVADFSKTSAGSILKEKALTIPAVCIGPVTAEAATRAGFKKVIISKILTHAIS